MKTFDITLSRSEQISAFVNVTNQFPFTIILRQGHFHVDGKSLLGICSLERSKPVVLEAYTNDCDDLIGQLQGIVL